MGSITQTTNPAAADSITETTNAMTTKMAAEEAKGGSIPTEKIKLKIFFVFALCFLQVLVHSVFLHHIFFNSENLRRLLHLITKIIKFTHKKKQCWKFEKKFE